MHPESRIVTMKYFLYDQPFELENGRSLPSVTISLSYLWPIECNKRNVIWICHALTANSDAADWWKGMVGQGCIFDTEKYFIVCANILGSTYGTTGPLSINPAYWSALIIADFPFITIRDMVNAHILLRRHLGIENILFAGRRKHGRLPGYGMGHYGKRKY